MARPPLEIGTHGDINAVRMSPDGTKPESWRARCRYRDLDGVTRPVERWAASKTKATKALTDACQARVATPAAKLDAGSRFRDFAAIYIEQIRAKRAGTTYDRYRSALNLHVLPAIGNLLIRECTTARIQDVLDDLEAAGYGGQTRSMVRTITRGTMQVAVRRRVAATNPTRDLDRIEHGKKRLPRALTAEQLVKFRTKLATHPAAQRSDLLVDVAEVWFGTGVRIGESLALRPCDVNLTDQPYPVDDPTGQIEAIPPWSIWINGNIVYVSGTGLLRSDGKTAATNRTVGAAPYLRPMLQRRVERASGPGSPLFPGRSGRWAYPGNVGRAFRDIRDDLGFPEFVSHWGRKTVATLLDDAGQSARQVADQLGQADIAVTMKHYLGRKMANPAAADAIEAWHQPKK